MVASIDLQVLLRLPMRGHVSCATCVSCTDVSIRLVLQIWWIFCLLIIAEGAELIQTLYHHCCVQTGWNVWKHAMLLTSAWHSTASHEAC